MLVLAALVLTLPPRIAERAPAAAHPVIELRLVRTDRGSGMALVSGGIPLAPGALRGGDLSRVRLRTGQVERPLYIAALKGLHPDGSLRSVLVQFRTTVSSDKPTEAVLELGVAPRLARASAAGTRDAVQAVALPLSAAYLVSTNLVGPTITANDSRDLGGAFPQYEIKAATFSNEHWRKDGSAWGSANYYDRALGHYALWVRSASPTYWQRATAIALNYRAGYLEKHDYGASPHWAQLEGLAIHYWVTGDEQSRRAVVETARRLVSAFPVERSADPGYQYNEGRIQQRVMLACLLAWQLGDTSRDWGALADAYVENWLRHQQKDGSFRYRLDTENANSPLGQSNFMEGLRMGALTKFYYARRRDPRILSAVRRQAEYLWTTQWVDGAGGFRYWNTTQGDVALDLNMLFVVGYGFLYRETGLERYRQRGDRIFASAVSGTYYAGTKQYNQQLYDSFLYLGLRDSPARTKPSRATSPILRQS